MDFYLNCFKCIHSKLYLYTAAPARFSACFSSVPMMMSFVNVPSNQIAMARNMAISWRMDKFFKEIENDSQFINLSVAVLCINFGCHLVIIYIREEEGGVYTVRLCGEVCVWEELERCLHLRRRFSRTPLFSSSSSRISFFTMRLVSFAFPSSPAQANNVTLY